MSRKPASSCRLSLYGLLLTIFWTVRRVYSNLLEREATLSPLRAAERIWVRRARRLCQYRVWAAVIISRQLMYTKDYSKKKLVLASRQQMGLCGEASDRRDLLSRRLQKHKQVETLSSGRLGYGVIKCAQTTRSAQERLQARLMSLQIPHTRRSTYTRSLSESTAVPCPDDGG